MKELKILTEKEIKKKMREIEVKHRNCGFEFNHYERGKDGELITTTWTCGKEVENCPHCKGLRYRELYPLKIKLLYFQEGKKTSEVEG